MIVIIIISICLAEASFKMFGCPSVPKIDVDLFRFAGIWHERIRDKNLRFERGECDQAQYTYIPEEQYIIIENAEKFNGKWHSIKGKGYIQEDGSVQVRDFNILRSAYLNIIETDYDNYLILSSCFSLYLFHWSYSWLMVRDKNMAVSDELINKALNAGLEYEDLFFTNQEHCPTYFGSWLST